MTGSHHRPLALTTAVITVGLAGIGPAALAQLDPETPELPEQEQARQAGALEEVVVTAQRREESAQDVAISMTMFDQEQISNANMVSAADIATYTPGMSVNTRFGPDNASFQIRGFTRDLRTTAAVGVYLAEVVAPRGQTSQTAGDGAGPGTMFDLENIQVLKGPQGTLFGRNTTGGAVLMSPQRPTPEFEGHVELSAGNFGMRQQEAVVNVPLHDRVRLRLGINNKERDGHLNNISGIGASRLGDVNYTAGRMSLEVDLTERIENYTLVNYADSDNKGYTSALFACADTDVTENPIVLLTGPSCEQQLEHQRETGQDGFYDVVSTVPNPRTAIEDLRVINHTTWHATEDITVKGILGYSLLETHNESDVFGTDFAEPQAAPVEEALDLIGLPLPATPVADPDREFSPGNTLQHPDYPVTDQDMRLAELQVQGFSFGGRLEWQVGAYYEDSMPRGPAGNIASILVSCDNTTLQSGNPDDFNCSDPLLGQVGTVLLDDFRTEYRNRAVYGQSTYDILEQLSVTAGLRYTWDKTRGRGVKTRVPFALDQPQETIVEVTNPSTESSAPTGLLEFQYRPIPDAMLYAKYQRGYRQGSVNLAADPGVDTHDEETVDTFEIGAKTEFHWPFPGRFNIAVFDNDFQDMQLEAGYVGESSGPTTAIFNAGRSRIRGLEFDGMLQPLPSLRATFSFSYLDTELREENLDEFQSDVEEAGGILAGATFSPIATEGEELPYAPEMSYTLGLDYTLPLPPALGMVSIGADYSYTGEQRATSDDTSPFAMLDSYGILNLNLRWRDILGQPFDFSAFVTNVRDEEYVTYNSGTWQAIGFDSRMVGMPRMYGARLRYNF